MTIVPIEERTYHRFILEYAKYYCEYCSDNLEFDDDDIRKVYNNFLLFDKKDFSNRKLSRYIFLFKKHNFLYNVSNTKNNDIEPDIYRASFFILFGKVPLGV